MWRPHRPSRQPGAPHTAPGDRAYERGDQQPVNPPSIPHARYRTRPSCSPEPVAAEKRGIWDGDWVFVTTEDVLRLSGNPPALLLRNRAGRLAPRLKLRTYRGLY